MVGQELPQEITDQIEAYLDEQENDEIDVIELYDRLVNLTARPLNINKMNFEDLKDMRLLSDRQIEDLLNHRVQYGDLISMEELQSIPTFTLSDIRRLRNFVRVNDTEKLNLSIPQMLGQSRNELFVKWGQILENKRGYEADADGNPRYLGDENRVFVRFKNSYENRLRIGFTLEKDPGEQWMQSARDAGFDYMTMHAYLKDYSTLFKDVAIGDYTISMGQGLISHNSFGSGKSAWVTNVKRGGRVVKPFNSVNENGFLRGAAVTLRLNPSLELTAFGSRVNRDGNPTDTLEVDETAEIRFSSLQTSGNHRTQSEIDDKRTIGMQTVGAVLKYKQRNFHIGLNGIRHQFDKNFDRSDNAENLFRFRGEELTNFSLDYSYRFKNINLFGESAYSSSGGLGHLAGLLIGLDRYASLSVLYRNYAKDYNALEPNAFGESSSINNEQGLYIGLEYFLTKRWKMSAYADFWKHPWLRFNVSRPSSGQEYLFRLDYNIKRKMLVYFQYVYENKGQDYRPESSYINQTGAQIRHRVRLHFNNKLNKQFELRTRVEYSRFENPIEIQNGYLFYQDFIFKSNNHPLSLTARLALFDTDDYESRIYAYENSVLYEFSIPALFDQGYRYYLNFRYRMTRKLTMELRWARTHYTRLELRTDPNSFFYTDAVGSNGNEQILGDTKSEVRVQMKYQF